MTPVNLYILLIQIGIQKSDIHKHGRDIHIHGPEYYILIYYIRDPYSNSYFYEIKIHIHIHQSSMVSHIHIHGHSRSSA